MPESSDRDMQTWEELFERGLFPERCPICQRVNLRNGPDYCSHWWGTEYDGELVEGPYCDECEGLWSQLYDLYQSPRDIKARGLIKKLRKSGLEDIARALVANDKSWWLPDVHAKVFIEPEASMVSGQGWSLYHVDPKWFEVIMERLRRAAQIANA
jgi:hypothetical protein